MVSHFLSSLYRYRNSSWFPVSHLTGLVFLISSPFIIYWLAHMCLCGVLLFFHFPSFPLADKAWNMFSARSSRFLSGSGLDPVSGEGRVWLYWKDRVLLRQPFANLTAKHLDACSGICNTTFFYAQYSWYWTKHLRYNK